MTRARCLLTLLGGIAAISVPALAHAPAAVELSAIAGTWVYVEDLTPGRTLEQLGPPMSSTFALATEEGAVTLVFGHGSGHRNVRIKLDGSPTDVKPDGATEVARYTAAWKDPVFSYQTEYIKDGETTPRAVYKRSFRVTENGLVVRVDTGRPGATPAEGLYRLPKDISMPTPAKAVIGDLAWLAGNWVGTRGSTGAIGIEERWSPPKGGSMLAISRTISRDRLAAFEYLRIQERDGGLVYIAQPNGAAPTEFILTEWSATKAVFENPRHDYPKRIAYELSSDGKLTATIGFLKGGTPGKFQFSRETP